LTKYIEKYKFKKNDSYQESHSLVAKSDGGNNILLYLLLNHLKKEKL